MSLLQQPLLHFLIIGSLLFGFYEFYQKKDEIKDESKIIHIDQSKLLEYIQYKSSNFDKDRAKRYLEEINNNQKQALFDELSREEILYREAKALQLDNNDYVIKKRLIQKLEFILQGLIKDTTSLEESQVIEFYEQQKSNYALAAHMTFTHLFINRQHNEDAHQLAQTKLKDLNKKNVNFSDGFKSGDRFPYHVNYVEKDQAIIASHFGVSMAKNLFQVPVNEDSWQGPFESPLGFHLVKIRKHSQQRIPALEEIYNQVRADAELISRDNLLIQQIDKIVANYRVEIDIETHQNKTNLQRSNRDMTKTTGSNK